ncbi:MAG: rhodanese-like domain-containing protein [Campylobacterota bacterium]
MLKQLFIVTILPLCLFAKSYYADDLSAKQAYAMQQEGVVLLDVRTQREYDSVHPKGAALVPVYFEREGERVFNERFVDNVYEQLGSYDTPVILICRTGSRTKEAANILANEGFNEVYNVTEGFANDWVVQKLPVQ